MKRSRIRSVVAIATVLLMVFASVAMADTLQSDLDAVLANDQKSVDLGSIAGDSVQSVPVTIYLAQTGNNNATLPISVTGSGDFGASMVAVTISGYLKPAGPNGTITFTAPAAQAAAQSYSITVEFSASPATNVTTAPAKVTIDFTVAASAPAVVAPQVSYLLTPSTPDGDNGWYTTGPVTLVWSVTGTSPTLTGCQDQSITADQAKTTYSCEATNSGGSDTESVEIGLDSTAPVITDQGPVAGTEGDNGWYTSAVTNRFTASDATSGLAGSTPIDVSTGFEEGDDVTVSSGAISDNAGNENPGIDSAAFKVDLSDPYGITFVDGPDADASYIFGSVPAAPTCTADDDVSGVASCAVTGYLATVGTHTMTATATDNAGRTATAMRRYTVDPWDLIGFGSPVVTTGSTSLPMWNTMKGGRTVPLKFEVFAGADELTDTGAIASFGVQAVNCGFNSIGTDLESVVDQITTTGQTQLRYDATEGHFIQNWQTRKVSSDTCYRISVVTLDGSFLQAYFKLTR